MAGSSRYDDLRKEIQALVAENDELKQMVRILQENQELKDILRTQYNESINLPLHESTHIGQDPIPRLPLLNFSYWERRDFVPEAPFHIAQRQPLNTSTHQATASPTYPSFAGAAACPFSSGSSFASCPNFWPSLVVSPDWWQRSRTQPAAQAAVGSPLQDRAQQDAQLGSDARGPSFRCSTPLPTHLPPPALAGFALSPGGGQISSIALAPPQAFLWPSPAPAALPDGAAAPGAQESGSGAPPRLSEADSVFSPGRPGSAPVGPQRVLAGAGASPHFFASTSQQWSPLFPPTPPPLSLSEPGSVESGPLPDALPQGWAPGALQPAPPVRRARPPPLQLPPPGPMTPDYPPLRLPPTQDGAPYFTFYSPCVLMPPPLPAPEWPPTASDSPDSVFLPAGGLSPPVGPQQVLAGAAAAPRFFAFMRSPLPAASDLGGAEGAPLPEAASQGAAPRAPGPAQAASSPAEPEPAAGQQAAAASAALPDGASAGPGADPGAGAVPPLSFHSSQYSVFSPASPAGSLGQQPYPSSPQAQAFAFPSPAPSPAPAAPVLLPGGAPFVLQPPPPGRKARKDAAGPDPPQDPQRPKERRALTTPETALKTTGEGKSKDSKQANVERIVGEIAFQLDRRILSAIFPDRVRLYGFTVRNIPKKVTQSGSDPYSQLDDKQASAIMERYNAVMNRLKPLGYDPNAHPRLTEQVVNTFGILRERPEMSGADAASYSDIQNLRNVVKETVPPDMHADCLLLLDCLHQLSQDDGKPLFIW